MSKPCCSRGEAVASSFLTILSRSALFISCLALGSACGEAAPTEGDVDASTPVGAGSSDAGSPDSGRSPEAVALVGTWAGTVDGSFGPFEVTVEIVGTGRFEVMSALDAVQQCELDGRWSVADGIVRLVGRDDCDGTRVTWIAPYSEQRLEGTWTASSGNGGTFVIEKR
jgi:hypothetical protein